MPKTTKDNMELDDLKKSWNTFDKQLQKENIIDEKQIAELIAKYQAEATKGLNKLTGFQKISLIIAAVIVLFFVVVILVDTSFLTELKITAKVVSMFVFVLITFVLAFWWDIKTYRFGRNTRVAEMSTIEVMERMDTFRKWASLEFKIIPFWSVVFFVLYYWLKDYHTQPLFSQLAFVSFSLIVVSTILFFLYKKIFKHLNEIKRNLEELKELENDK